MFQLDDVKQLLQQADDHMLTLYLAADPGARENQAAPPAWRIWLKDALREIEHDQNGNSAWPAIGARAEEFFLEYRPSSKGLALFTGADFQPGVRAACPR
jgi:hypothetical protein